MRATDGAVLGYDGACLTVEAYDQMFMARATGSFPGNAYVNASLVAALVRALPAGDPLVVRCDVARLTVGSMSVGCDWRPMSDVLVRAPTARDWLVSLALPYMMPRARIAAGGLMKEVEAAERKLAQLVARTARSLAPFGVTRDDLRRLVEQRLRERCAARGSIPVKPDTDLES